MQEGVKYADPLTLVLQAKKAQKGKNLSEAPFKAATPMKKSVTPGDYYGTSGKVPHMAVGTAGLGTCVLVLHWGPKAWCS